MPAQSVVEVRNQADTVRTLPEIDKGKRRADHGALQEKVSALRQSMKRRKMYPLS
jgi:hypothetical protein